VDTRHFDALTRMLSTPESRRRLLGALAALPVAGGLLERLALDEAEAKERRRRRKSRHKRRRHKTAGKRRRQQRRKAQRRHRKRRCTPEPVSHTCAGRCGQVTNNCGQVVECAPCCTGLTPTDDLQAAINAAADGDTITLCPGTWVVPAMLKIGKPLTLVGAGAGKTILDGDGQHRVLAITANVPVTLQALTITRGTDNFGGGGIHSIGNLTLIDAELTANESTNTDINNGGGGAIINYNNLTLRNTVVHQNTSATIGGGILTESGTLTLESGTSIEWNEAGTYGGGIFINTNASTVVMESGSRVFKNRVAGQGGGIAIAFGGALTLQPGSEVTENEATQGGGALYIFSGSATIEEDVLICGNTSPQCGSGAVNGICPESATCPV
jgi:hypothetical protein